MVGALIVRDGEQISEGYHERAGCLHAEAAALKRAHQDVTGADLYVTLEPCCHWGHQPPCTEAIIQAGIRRVFMAMEDPNPLVAGKGREQLRANGIEVIDGPLQEEAAFLNEAYCKYIQTGHPFVILKAAMSLDGKIATSTGESKWITSSVARQRVHQLRNEVDAIVVGIGTVLADDPSLTTRIPDGRDAVRVVVDSHARLPLSATLCHVDSDAPTLLATTELASTTKRHRLEDLGVEVLVLPAAQGRVDLQALMAELGKRKICSVLIEGGGTLHAGALAAGIPDKIHWFVAPKFIGGSYAPGPIGDPGIKYLSQATQISHLRCERMGDDWLFTGYIRPPLRNTDSCANQEKD